MYFSAFFTKVIIKIITFLKGIFTLSCTHKYFFGFMMMLMSEGPRIFQHLLYSRFNKAPKIVLYDNGMHSQLQIDLKHYIGLLGVV